MDDNIQVDTNVVDIEVPCIVFFVLTPIFLVIRISSRVKTGSGLGWDDYTIMVSWAFAQIVSSLLIAACMHGFGQHIYMISAPEQTLTLKLYYVAQAFYKLTLNLTKASVLLLYLRIFLQRWFKISCYVLLSIILGYMVATTASSIWQCTPISRAWDKSVPGTCISITGNWYANAGFSIATDIAILVLPMQPIYRSNLPTKQKWALIIVFALGIFVTITSILRMQTLDFSSTSSDPTYDVASSTWTVIEENVAIICACLPMCKGPLNYLFPSIFASAPRRVSAGFKPSQHSNNSSRSYWAPMRGDREMLSTRVTCVQGRKPSTGGNSQEYMLEHTYSRDQISDIEEVRGIRKVIQYDITVQTSGGSMEPV
ncbi:integral membrane protein [Annulohypoxylon bovei var. microspora]|nr:integral membrane protein [Annulohypoxylon bovei var. microspora]